MKRLLRMLSSRAASPLVIGFFLMLYIGIAFFTDETLTALMEFIRRSSVLIVVLALLPLNNAARIVTETCGYFKRRRALAGNEVDAQPELFDDTVELSVSPSFADLQGRLDALGYKTRRTESALAAWRGTSAFPARLLYLIGTFCLFAGILISLTTRISYRGTVIEGEPLPLPPRGGGIVERISLGNATGPILSKDLTMEAAPSGSGEGRKTFGVYPPGLYKGAFVYPRYLGIGLAFRFSAPDLREDYETHAVLAIYPPGKEATLEIPGSPYRIVFSLAQPDDGTDPYMTGLMTFHFVLLKEKEAVFSGSAPSGGGFVKDGYRLSIPDSRRLVITDFIRDYGVLLIWAAGMLIAVAGSIWLTVRVFFPRREMLFRAETDKIRAFSCAEGRGRRHGGVFHEALDFLEARRGESHG